MSNYGKPSKVKDIFDRMKVKNLKLNTKFAEMELEFNDDDKSAAWELYVELVTRITTQPLPDEDGDEETALNSVYSLFGTTRSILKQKGRSATLFSKVAIVVLNQVIRPFTAKWHKKKLAGAFENSAECREFRKELEKLQRALSVYALDLSVLADVEDMVYIQEDDVKPYLESSSDM